jgi:hypothetical protein
VSGVDTLWVDCVLAVLMFMVHHWFTERGGRSAAVLGNHPISVGGTDQRSCELEGAGKTCYTQLVFQA